LYFLISSTLVLAILLSETALLYRRLARSVVAQSREREARLMTIGVLSAAIAHEVSASVDGGSVFQFVLPGNIAP
jgi:hypothetical protein